MLEHIADDRGAVRAPARDAQPGGRLVLLVPAHQALYGTIDEAIGHHRRYEREDLDAPARRVPGSRSRATSTSTRPSIPGWFLNGRLLKRRSVPGVQARLANRLVPLYRLERRFNLPFGLSVIAVARRGERPVAEAVG